MKRTVLISKVGGVFYTREQAAKNSAVGEQGETEGIINHLLQRDDIQLVYFGQWYGDVPDNLIHIEACLEDLNEMSTSKYQQECWKRDIEKVEGLNPEVYVNIAGYASTMSWIGNPKSAGVQAAAVRYTSPVLNLLQHFKLPRIVINNDPRSYPREGEMGLGWEYILPTALLSQRTLNWARILQGTKIYCREVYAGCENWCEHIRLIREKVNSVSIVSHAHILDGCKFKARDAAWSKILSPPEDITELKSMGMKIYGKGWEHFSGFDPELMTGVIRPNEVMEVLASAKVCPAVAAGNNFYTGKLRTCLAQGCLPLFYGRGEPFTFDPLGKYLPLNSEFRVNKPGDLLKRVKYFDTQSLTRDMLISDLWEASKPDWSMLDNCLNDILNGRDTKSDSWRQAYGGYWYA